MNKILTRKSVLYLMVSLTCLSILAYYVTDKLIIGARWSSGFPLAAVDNFYYGNGNLYPVEEDGITPGSSYFPGLIFLSFVLRFLFGYGAETAFVVYGAITAVLTVIGFSFVAFDNKRDRFWFTVVAFFLFIKDFPNAKTYLLEVHPDIPSLMFFLWGVVVVDKYIKNNKLYFILISSVLFIISGLFKQNAAFLFIGLGIYTIFTRAFRIQQKLFILACEFVSGIIIIGIICLINGCWFNCVIVNSLHPLLSLNDYLYYVLITLKANIIFLLLLLLYFIWYLPKNPNRSSIERIWLIPSTLWFLFCMYGAAKKGANSGNMEAAIIAYMPYALLVINDLLGRLKKYTFITNYIINQTANKCYMPVRYIILYSFLLYIICFFSIKSVSNIKTYSYRLDKQRIFSEWLSNNFKDKPIAYNIYYYELLNGSRVKKTTDLHTAYVWEMGGLVPDLKLLKFSLEEKWAAIITIKGYDDNVWPTTFSNYRKLESTEYPSIGKDYGNLLEIYVKKENL